MIVFKALFWLVDFVVAFITTILFAPFTIIILLIKHTAISYDLKNQK